MGADDVTMRREKTVALAEILGVEAMAGEGTMALMDRCLEKAAELTGKSLAGDDEGDGGEVERAELAELTELGRRDRQPPMSAKNWHELEGQKQQSGTLAAALDAADRRAAEKQRPPRARRKRGQSAAQAS